MDSLAKLFIERAESEIIEAETLFKLSEDAVLKEQLKIESSKTFYSGVISHSYYSIFYCAKAYLLAKNIKIDSPREHQKVYNSFAKLVKEGVIQQDLLKIYDEEIMKAEALLEILGDELGKRTNFTYKTLPQANKQPATESIENANIFYKIINAMIKDSTEI